MLNFYLYSVTSISLAVFYVAALVLVNGLLQLWLGGDVSPSTSKSIAAGLGFATVACPMWWVHWRWLRLQFSQAKGGAITWHRFYLFTIVCLNAMAMLIGGGIGITTLTGALLGLSDSLATGVAGAGVALFALGLSIGLWLHHWHQFKGNLGQLLPQ